MIYKFVLFYCVLGFVLTGCGSIFSGIYGIKKMVPVDESAIISCARRYDIPLEDCYEMDTAYNGFLLSWDSSRYAAQINNHYQPLQALYFDNSERLAVFYVNCYAGGFPNLKWNRHQALSTFPPRQQAPLDNILDLSTQLKYLRPLSMSRDFLNQNYDYFIFVYWNKFMGRQSKRFIKQIQKNVQLNTASKIKVIYINTDNLYTSE